MNTSMREESWEPWDATSEMTPAVSRLVLADGSELVVFNGEAQARGMALRIIGREDLADMERKAAEDGKVINSVKAMRWVEHASGTRVAWIVVHGGCRNADENGCQVMLAKGPAESQARKCLAEYREEVRRLSEKLLRDQ